MRQLNLIKQSVATPFSPLAKGGLGGICSNCKAQVETLYQQKTCKACLHKDFARLRPLLTVKPRLSTTIGVGQ